MPVSLGWAYRLRSRVEPGRSAKGRHRPRSRAHGQRMRRHFRLLGHSQDSHAAPRVSDRLSNDLMARTAGTATRNSGKTARQAFDRIASRRGPARGRRIQTVTQRGCEMLSAAASRSRQVPGSDENRPASGVLADVLHFEIERAGCAAIGRLFPILIHRRIARSHHAQVGSLPSAHLARVRIRTKVFEDEHSHWMAAPPSVAKKLDMLYFQAIDFGNTNALVMNWFPEPSCSIVNGKETER